jgi:hypothetical protein
MLRVIGEILIEVCKRVFVGAEGLIRRPESISSCQLAESLEINDIQRTALSMKLKGETPNVIWFSLQPIFPESLFPEPESLDFCSRITHGGISVRGAMQVQIHQSLQIRPNNLIGIHKNHFIQIEGEQDVQEKNLVSPYRSLFLPLTTKPVRPFIRHELVIKTELIRQQRNEFLPVRVVIPECGTLNEGDKKFSMNQNLTVLLVCFNTLWIMM